MGQENYLAYPLMFRPIYKEKIWGGQNLKTELNRAIPARKKIGESWEIACLGDDVSVVSNGPYEGLPLSDLIRRFPKELLGTDVAEKYPDRFPLLFKLIDANEPISVQVHPHDGQAEDMEAGQWGKTEMWHVLWASPDAKVISGLKDWVNQENLPVFLANGQIQECVQTIPVCAGNTIYVPPGRVHGTMGSMVLLEVQENSDVTYRLHDWNREGPGHRKRPLHLEKALEVIEFDDDEEALVNPIVTKKTEVEERLLVTCDYFTVEKISVPIFYQDTCSGDRFCVYFIASGKGEICPQGIAEEAMVFTRGDFLFLPASLEQFEIQTDTGCEILKTVVT